MPSERYCRQIKLIGKANQLKLANGSVLVTGVGGPAGINMCKLLMQEKK